METQQALKKIALNDLHEQLGGKMVGFAGYNMPVRYESQIEEHHTVRNAVGVFDVSHMGEFILEGENALALIQYVTSNDAAKLSDGKVQYSCLPNDKGGIVDDLLVYRIRADKYMLVVNASNIEKDWAWISSHNSFGVKMTDISDDTSLFAVQGPKAAAALQSLTDIKLADMEYYTFEIGTFAGVPNVVVSATGYTGAGGFEIYVPNKFALSIWTKIFDAGKDFGIKPIGLAARDTLRLEMGFCLYGNDIDDTTSPIEAGLGWITKFTKNFINSDYIKAHKDNGTAKKLVGFELTEKGIARQHYAVKNENGDTVGEVTSGTQSPTLGKAVGMAYVPTELSKPGSKVFIDIRGKLHEAVVVKMPFLKK